ncbi:DnaJ -like protein subfamily C member 3 [Halotydeus destructor]|nr:DnaJ -like protein subfamily C member 3 [Halotydeus destructor]
MEGTPELRKFSVFRKYLSLWVFLLSYSCNFELVRCGTYEEIEKHMEEGRHLLAQGLYNDALTHYHAAVELDSNYMTHFRRATVYLALGKHKSALEDLNEVILKKPDFIAARLQRGSVLLKQGRLDEAHIDLEWVLRQDPYHDEATHLYTMIEPLKQQIQQAYLLMADAQFAEAVELLSGLLSDLPWDVKLREMRAQAFEKLGDIMSAIGDLRSTTKMRADNTDGFLKLSKLHYELGEPDESLTTIRECLKLDPDHKLCHTHYKKVKKLVSQIKNMNEYATQGQYNECAEKANTALKTEKDVHRVVHLIKAKKCHCLNKAGLSDEAITVCTEALKLDDQDVNALCDRGDAYLNNENYDDAFSDYQRAHSIDQGHSRAEEGMKRSKKLQQQAGKRDYYKILGLKRTASKREVTKAYRKLAQKWHPDNFQSETEKKSAEKKFMDIAAAKEVLSDDEKRQKFDMGEDPLDPESQQGGGHPFHGGFNPFGQQGSGYSFKFHFS